MSQGVFGQLWVGVVGGVVGVVVGCLVILFAMADSTNINLSDFILTLNWLSWGLMRI